MARLNETPAEAGEAVINRRIPGLDGNSGAIVLAANGGSQVALYSDDPLPLPGSGSAP